MHAPNRTKRYAIAALVVVAFIGLLWQRARAGRQTASGARPLPLVQVTTPGVLDLQRRLLLTADILPIQQADLMARVPGYLDAIYVDRGDRVRAGQVLAQLSQPELEHQLQQAQANYGLAKVTFERTQDLFAKELIAKQNLDDARNKYEVAKRTLEVQQTYVEYTRIVAPFDGYVTKRYVDPGALITQGGGAASGNAIVTVMDLSRVKVLVNVPERVYPVGRLDKESTGLLLLTNDGRLHQRLSHPSFDHEKEYDVVVARPLSDGALRRMAAGMPLLNTRTRPAEVHRIGARRFRIVLKEGRNRQIRRMVRQLGNEVIELKRVRVAHVRLGRLPKGRWRHLTDAEVQALLS